MDPTPYDDRLDPDRRRDTTGVWVEESEAAVVREVFALYTQEGHSLQGAATYLKKRGVPTPTGKKIWSLVTLRSYVTPARLRGTGLCPTLLLPARPSLSLSHPSPWVALSEHAGIATIPALVSQEQFDLAQAKLAQNQSFATRNNKRYEYLLWALVSCGQC